jgi:ergothioneine biosynthesis protein EgtB
MVVSLASGEIHGNKRIRRNGRGIFDIEVTMNRMERIGRTAHIADRERSATYLSREFARVRADSMELAAPLSAEDACVQSMPDASPAKWHLAHTTWFFETFVLERFEPGFKPFRAEFRVLFNSYYNNVGDRHPRPQRGMLTRPPLATIHDYRRDVDARMHRLLQDEEAAAALRHLVVLGLNHEQQHQELLLTDVKHLLSLNPLAPAYRERAAPLSPRDAEPGPALQWVDFEGGVAAVGHRGPGFAFDNECPCHDVLLQPFRLGARLVTNGDYLHFVEEGGYADARLWLSEGWDWIKQNRLAQPMYWRRDEGAWKEFTFGGLFPLEPGLPVVHVSYFEADACARWAGARLPTEQEWEHAAETCDTAGHFADDSEFHPRAASPAPGLQQMFGDAWEWTQSSYAPYPGFRIAEGAIGEYNGKFMVNQYVLRGGSCVTPVDHIRASYRNFFPTSARWQFSGIRLARDGTG